MLANHMGYGNTAAFERLVKYIRWTLPEGQSLPDDVWQARHRGIRALLWLHAIGVVCFGLIVGAWLEHGLAEGAVLAAMVVMAQLAATTPAVMILDLHLPHVSGQTILQQIRADERLAKTRILLVTADALIAESLREEADLVLLKPIGFHQLRDLAKRLRPPDIIGLD